MSASTTSRRVAVITGAGGGIGRAVSIDLASRGFALALVGRRPEPLEETAARAAGAEAIVLTEDMSDPDAPERIVESAVRAFGRIDAIVNNAACAPVRPIAETDAELLRTTMTTNVHGPALLVRAAWSALSGSGAGRVVNVSSMATVEPFPGFTAYAMSKAAVESLTRSIQVEGVGNDILGFTVAPGAVWTDMLLSVVPDFPRTDALPAEAVAAVIAACAAGERDSDAGQVIRIMAGDGTA